MVSCNLKYALCLTALGVCLFGQTYEERAVAISREIQARHIPFGTVVNPMYTAADSNTLLTYTRCGDSAIWTGHWLAAESFRYRVTRSAEALQAALLALNGLETLVHVTAEHNLLARCVVRPESPYAAGPRNEEAHHGEYTGRYNGADYVWFGNTSRDQYLGALFGLSAAFEHIEDPAVRARISVVVSKLIDRLLEKNWSVVMPGGQVSTVFWLRPEQQLAILQVGRQVNPARFTRVYEDKRSGASGLELVMSVEAREPHDSYFKFNLNAIAFFNLLRLEEQSSSKRAQYVEAYLTFRRAVAAHGNAFFNVIDRALRGPDPRRDSETTELIAAWLQRPTRDTWVDLRGKYRACGEDRACDAIPVPERVRTDFLWQRSPFLLYGGGESRIESAGIDFILPYWMSRYYGADLHLTAVSAASGASMLAPASIGTLFGTGFPANARVRVAGQDARVFFSGPEQINFSVPADTSIGSVAVSVHAADGTQTHFTTTEITRTAPALFSANATGRGVAAAIAVRPGSNGTLVEVPVFRCTGPLLCVTQELDTPVYVSLFGTGVRGGTVTVRINGQSVPVLYSGPQPEFEGLDQINIRIDSSFPVHGEHDLVVTADGRQSNAVRIRLD